MAGSLAAAEPHVLGGHGDAALAVTAPRLASPRAATSSSTVPSLPEPCVDSLAPHIGKALAWLCGGVSFSVALGLAAAVNDKASKTPYTLEVYPYENLRVHRGGRP